MAGKVVLGAAVGGGVLALGLLTACAGPGQAAAGGTTTPPGTVSDFAPVTTSAPAGSGAVTTGTAVSRCHIKDLSAHVGAVSTTTVTLVYTNMSGQPCTMDGYGGVDLHGPADPNGPVFSLRRDPDVQGRDANTLPKPGRVTLAPGGTAHTVITFGRYETGDIGSMGSTRWVPTDIVSTPPNETTSLTTAWPTGVPVLRDDAATISHSYISPIESGA